MASVLTVYIYTLCIHIDVWSRVASYLKSLGILGYIIINKQTLYIFLCMKMECIYSQNDLGTLVIVSGIQKPKKGTGDNKRKI